MCIVLYCIILSHSLYSFMVAISCTGISFITVDNGLLLLELHYYYSTISTITTTIQYPTITIQL